MAKPHKLELSESEIQALIALRDKGEPAYLRERATALLKIHEGVSPHEVARRGLLKKRNPDTVYAWLRRYSEHGICGLFHKPGRGRKPAFSPKAPEVAKSELLQAIGQDPGLSIGIKHAGRSAPSVRSCHGLKIYRCRAFIKSFHAWVSVISVPETMCEVRTEIMLKNLLASSKL